MSEKIRRLVRMDGVAERKGHPPEQIIEGFTQPTLKTPALKAFLRLCKKSKIIFLVLSYFST